MPSPCRPGTSRRAWPTVPPVEPTPRKPPKEDVLLVAAGIRGADPELGLRAVASRLEEMRICPPRGGTSWSASSVKALLDRAERRHAR